MGRQLLEVEVRWEIWSSVGWHWNPTVENPLCGGTPHPWIRRLWSDDRLLSGTGTYCVSLTMLNSCFAVEISYLLIKSRIQRLLSFDKKSGSYLDDTETQWLRIYCVAERLIPRLQNCDPGDRHRVSFMTHSTVSQPQWKQNAFTTAPPLRFRAA